jgi:uncharacterized protein (TIGR04562 family)
MLLDILVNSKLVIPNMQRSKHLSKYRFNWETLDVMVGGKSALDVNSYLGRVDGPLDIDAFLKGYGFEHNNPIQMAELFGNFQEAIQFIKRYFLREGNPDGLDVTIPSAMYTITDFSQLLAMASIGIDNKSDYENAIWAGIILKVMHTILHADKDLRYRYFSTIQLQVFDRIYKYLKRDGDDLYLEDDEEREKIPLIEFETKSKKSRDSIIIKLLHKKENVAEELFDRIGIRFVTTNKLDALRVLKFLHNNYVVVPHNIKPSRSMNTLFDMDGFREKHYKLTKIAIKENLSEDEIYAELLEAINNSPANPAKHVEHNKHSSSKYSALHFTCRQLIKYRNPFMDNFSEIRKLARALPEETDLSKKIIELDTSSVTRDVRFFYPFEVQITDIESHGKNTEGEASHREYKKNQVLSAMKRIFKTLIEYKNIDC